MTDVNSQVSETPEVTVEETTTQPASQPVNQTANVTGTEGKVTQPIVPGGEEGMTPSPEKTVPYSRFSEVNKKYRDMERKMAEIQGQKQLEGYGQQDWDQILSNPFVQELLIKDAKRELTDYAREVLDQYPTLHPQLKKAILSNSRGFINETTTDVESAKIDLLDYIEKIVADEPTQPQTAPAPKTFPIADSNSTNKVDSKGRPADIQKILEKPIDTWTEEEAQVVEEYSRTIPKK